MPPTRLDWLGTAPPAALVAALAARDVRLHHAPAPGDAPCVLASAAGRRPRAPAERAWIWGCEGRLDDAAATAAVLDGAYDVVALGAADAADRLAARAHELAAAVPPVAPSSDVVARSAAARRMLAQAARAARTSMAVLLTGETGSGKELLARLVHQWSPRRALVEAGAFGADLYERLAIVTIALPPLRERLEDLPELAQRFVERFYAEETEAGPRVRGLRADTLRALAAYPWPGNVRELRNVVWETLVYKRAGDEIIPSDLPRRVLRPGATPPQASLIDRGAVARKLAARALNLKDEIAALQRAALAEALALTGGNAAEAARLLGAVGRGRAKDPGGTVRAMLRRLAR